MATVVFKQQSLQIFAFGLLLYLMAAGGSYLYLAVESSHIAERQALEAQQQRRLAAQEMELARQLQARLLPPAELVEEGFHLAARNLPASFVAGDFYDYFQLPDGTWRLAVADVAGKGMAASLITATVKAILPLIAADRSVVEAMGELNRRLKAQLDRREFVALMLAAWDPAQRHLELVNAGLPDPYLLRSSKKISLIEAPTPRLPLGLRAELEYHSVQLILAPGDRVLFLTDGLPEAPDAAGDPLGYEALERLLDHPAAAPGPWLDHLLERVRAAATEELEDDWTTLLLTVPKN
jgi:sigma-B regulation protein RsbU (phosphoserine phosphatase)